MTDFSRSYHLTIPQRAPLLNEIKEMHYRNYKKLRDSWAWWVMAAARASKINLKEPPMERCIVMIHRFSWHPSNRMPDWDGLYGGIKPILDCLTLPSKSNPSGIGLIVDDSPKHIVNLNVMPVLCLKSEVRTEIAIMELPPDG